MKKILFTLSLLFALQCAYTQHIGCDGDRYFNTVFENVQVTTNIIYGQNTTLGGNTIDLRMDIYEPTGDVLAKRPVIVFAHGGGFISGAKEGLDFICEDFAQRGFVTASISYRLIDAPITDSTGLAEAVILAAHDMKAAIRYLREDAATADLYHIDPNHIFAGGLSAGAVTANIVGFIDETDAIPSYIQEILDAHGGLEGNSSANTQYSSDVQGVLNYSGSIAGVHYIDADDPPLYSFHNELDPIVPCDNSSGNAFPFPTSGYGSCEMHAAAEALGIKNKFYFYSQSDGHVLWPYTYVRHETAQFLGEILCETPAPPTAWEEASSGFEVPGFGIRDIEIVDENVIWTVATPPRFDVATQQFARTTDGGQTWVTGTIPVSDPAYGSYSISALDESRAWAIAYDYDGHNAGKVYKTTDGGLTWTEQTSAFTDPNEAPHGIHFFDENDGFAFAFVDTDNGDTDSHAGYITSDGGATWEKLLPTVYPAQPGERIVDLNLDFMEAKGDHLWIGMNTGDIYHSSDRGHTWEVNTIDAFQSIASVAFKDEMNGIAVSNYNTFVGIFINRVYATSDGGVTWSEIQAPPAPSTAGIHFVEGSADAPGACGTYIVYYGFLAGGGPGTAYTTDDGQTWTFISEQPVYSIDFASPELGWAGGISHSPENGLFKWTGPALTGNDNCLTSVEATNPDVTNLLIYPNPVSTILTITVNNQFQGDVNLIMVNILGQEVHNRQFWLQSGVNTWTVPVESLPAGSYRLLLSDGVQLVSQSFIKQ